MTEKPYATGLGFTLMELLLVIAIIALLVSILMPSLKTAKALARMAVCQATVHTMALANSQYQSDYDGFSVHGQEWWAWWELRLISPGISQNDTGYGLPLFPTDVLMMTSLLPGGVPLCQPV